MSRSFFCLSTVSFKPSTIFSLSLQSLSEDRNTSQCFSCPNGKNSYTIIMTRGLSKQASVMFTGLLPLVLKTAFILSSSFCRRKNETLNKRHHTIISQIHTPWQCSIQCCHNVSQDGSPPGVGLPANTLDPQRIPLLHHQCQRTTCW